MKNTFLTIGFALLFIQQFCFCQNIPFRHFDLWGLSDLKGNIVLEPKYDSVEFIIPHIFKAKVWKDNKIGMIDGNGREIIPPVYENVIDNYSYIKVVKNQKEGLLNLQGKIILSIKYSSLEETDFNFIILTINNKKGIGKFVNNKVIIKQLPSFDNIKFLYPENIFECERKGIKQYLDTLLRPTDLYKIERGVESVDSYSTFKSFDDINEEQKILIPYPQNQDIVINRDSALFKIIYERKNGKWGVRKCDGTILVAYKYEDLDLKNTDLQDIHSGYRQLYILKYNGKWGMIGHKNKDARHYTDTITYNLIDFKYDSIYCNVNCTYYILQDNRRIGIVSAKDFSKIIQPKYLYIRETYDKIQDISIFWVQTANGKCGYINENGVEYFNDK